MTPDKPQATPEQQRTECARCPRPIPKGGRAMCAATSDGRPTIEYLCRRCWMEEVFGDHAS